MLILAHAGNLAVGIGHELLQLILEADGLLPRRLHVKIRLGLRGLGPPGSGGLRGGRLLGRLLDGKAQPAALTHGEDLDPDGLPFGQMAVPEAYFANSHVTYT